MRTRITIALVVAATILVGLLPASTQAQVAQTPPIAANPFTPSPVFSADGYALVIYTGSSSGGLEVAARNAGANGAWVQDARGNFQLLPTNATPPPFLTGAFNAAIPSVAGPIAVTLVRPLTPKPNVITLDQDGATFAMRVGDTVTLTLGTTYNWSVGPMDTNVVRPVVNIAAPPAGTQGTFTAVGAGSTDLTASGGLNCPAMQPCPAIARLFRVHLIVYP